MQDAIKLTSEVRQLNTGNKYRYKSYTPSILSIMSKLISLQLPFAKLVGWSITKKDGFSGVSDKVGKAFATGFHVLTIKLDCYMQK